MENLRKLIREVLISEEMDECPDLPPVINKRRLFSNVSIIGNKMYSYETHVATIDPATRSMFVPEASWNWSMSTSKQIRKVADHYCLQIFTKYPEKRNLVFPVSRRKRYVPAS